MKEISDSQSVKFTDQKESFFFLEFSIKLNIMIIVENRLYIYS
jgi:hypothetical protein